ncbi:MAG: hypothetical protein MJ163_01445, partial [Alphaproteobacteria bacterium]|nr:hypothetical protein [Alphaproteobacteria bacterium]
SKIINNQIYNDDIERESFNEHQKDRNEVPVFSKMSLNDVYIENTHLNNNTIKRFVLQVNFM